MIVELLPEVSAQFRDSFERSGVSIELVPAEGTHPRRAAVLTAKSERGIAEMTLWESGEMNLVVADHRSGEVLLDEHREVFSDVGITDAMLAIEELLALPER